jgi:hypothetical protein
LKRNGKRKLVGGLYKGTTRLLGDSTGDDTHDSSGTMGSDTKRDGRRHETLESEPNRASGELKQSSLFDNWGNYKDQSRYLDDEN